MYWNACDENPQRGKMLVIKHDYAHVAPEERNLDDDEYPQRGKMLIVNMNINISLQRSETFAVNMFF